jgi:hypothetical protein
MLSEDGSGVTYPFTGIHKPIAPSTYMADLPLGLPDDQAHLKGPG